MPRTRRVRSCGAPPARKSSASDSVQATSDRVRRNLGIFLKFGVVGASGVVVILIVVLAVTPMVPPPESLFTDLPLTRFNVRWYHAISTIAFMVANLWNFQLNRFWAFRTSGHSRWGSEYLPFLAVGLAGQVIGLGLLTLLMHPGSVLSLPRDALDD